MIPLVVLFSEIMVLTSCERVHKWWLGDCAGNGRRTVLLGLANLGVALCKLEPDCLGQVGIEPHTLLQERKTRQMVRVIVCTLWG